MGPTSSAETSGADVKEEKSDTYSNNMTEAMGAGKFSLAVFLASRDNLVNVYCLYILEVAY